MEIKKNLGIILIVLGILLSMDRTSEFHGIVDVMVLYIKDYWPIMLTLIGIYLLSAPRKKKHK